jgi:hypothetical protein
MAFFLFMHFFLFFFSFCICDLVAIEAIRTSFVYAKKSSGLCVAAFGYCSIHTPQGSHYSNKRIRCSP